MEKNISKLITGVFLLVAIGLSAQPDLTTIKNFKYSELYSFKVNGKLKPVFESKESLQSRGWTVESSNGINYMSFVNFDLPETGTANIEVELSEDFTSFDFRPFKEAAKLQVTKAGSKLSFTVDKPGQLVLRINNSWDNVLCIFVNPHHIKPKASDVTHYFDTTKVHDYYKGPLTVIPNNPKSDIQTKEEVDAIVLNTGESIYIEEGAVLRARIEVAKNAKNVKIFGRGMIAFGLGHVENFSVISADGSRNENLTVEGITVVDAPGWILRMFSPANFVVDNFKTVGQWHFNTDGIQFAGNDGEIKNCFLQCNDDNFSMPSYIRNVDIHDMQLWNIFNGGAINFGWGNPNANGMTFEDITILRSGDCCGPEFQGQNEVYRRKAPITMISYGDEKLENITFKNIIIEEVIKEGQWIHFLSNKEGEGYIRNIEFDNVQVLNINKSWGLFKGSKTNGISDITFNNLKINGSYIKSAAQANLHMENTEVSSIVFYSDDPATEKPAAPIELTATLQGKINVQLTWVDSADNEFLFVIERKTAASEWDSIGFTAPNALLYTDKDLEPGETYCYRVFARNNMGASATTNEVCQLTDASLKGEILKNPDFESGIEKWEGYYTSINEITDPVKSGSKSIVVDHGGKWKGVKQDITTEIFKYASADSFYTEAWVRTVSGEIELYVNVMTVNSSGQKKYHPTKRLTVNSTEWSLLSGYLDIDLTGITSVLWYVETPTDSQDDFIVDNCTMKTSALASSNSKLKYLSSEPKLFPNPTTGVFNVKLNGQERLKFVRIYDMSGKLMHEKVDCGTGTQIDAKTLESGMYVVKTLTVEGQHFVNKLIIK